MTPEIENFFIERNKRERMDESIKSLAREKGLIVGRSDKPLRDFIEASVGAGNRRLRQIDMSQKTKVLERLKGE